MRLLELPGGLVKDPALSLLELRFNIWPKNLRMLRVTPKKKKKKKRKESWGEREEAVYFTKVGPWVLCRVWSSA